MLYPSHSTPCPMPHAPFSQHIQIPTSEEEERKKLTLQCSHRFLTELCTFIPLVCCCCIATFKADKAVVGLAASLGDRAACEMARAGCFRAPPTRICRVAGAALGAARDNARKADVRIDDDDDEAAILSVSVSLPLPLSGRTYYVIGFGFGFGARSTL